MEESGVRYVRDLTKSQRNKKQVYLTHVLDSSKTSKWLLFNITLQNDILTIKTIWQLCNNKYIKLFKWYTSWSDELEEVVEVDQTFKRCEDTIREVLSSIDDNKVLEYTQAHTSKVLVLQMSNSSFTLAMLARKVE